MTIFYTDILIVDGSVTLLLELLVNLTDLPREVLLLAVLIHDLPKLLAHVVLFDRTVMVFERRQAYPREVECCAYKVGLVALGTDIAHEN